MSFSCGLKIEAQERLEPISQGQETDRNACLRVASESHSLGTRWMLGLLKWSRLSLEQISFILQTLGQFQRKHKGLGDLLKVTWFSVNSGWVAWPQVLFRTASLENASLRLTFTAWIWTCLDFSVFLNENVENIHLNVPRKNLTVYPQITVTEIIFFFIFLSHKLHWVSTLALLALLPSGKTDYYVAISLVLGGKQKHKING